MKAIERNCGFDPFPRAAQATAPVDGRVSDAHLAAESAIRFMPEFPIERLAKLRYLRESVFEDSSRRTGSFFLHEKYLVAYAELSDAARLEQPGGIYRRRYWFVAPNDPTDPPPADAIEISSIVINKVTIIYRKGQ